MKKITTRFRRQRFLALPVGALVVLGVACEPAEEPVEPTSSAIARGAVSIAQLETLDPPAADGAMAPNLALTDRGPILSWLQPTDQGHALRVAHLEGESWSEAVTVAEGDDFFANWADFPAVIQSPDGSLFSHWLHKLALGTYAYGAGIAHWTETDGWVDLGWLHDDLSATEHGFVSYASSPEGVQAFWLDGREMEFGGPMALRTRSLGTGAGADPPISELLDVRVCECCQTGAALTAEGPIVVYRNRSEDEIRDPWRVRWTGDRWSEPAPVSRDGWEIAGCPVNGPTVAAAENRVVVAWFTAANSKPQVRVAISSDSGESFDQAIVLDDHKPTGRVGLALGQGALGQDTAWVSWLGEGPEGSAVLLASVDLESSTVGAIRQIADTSTERAAGFPRLLLDQDRLLFAWVESGEPSRIRVGALPIGSEAAAR